MPDPERNIPMWLPGMPLDHEFPVATAEELIRLHEGAVTGRYAEVPGVLGVVRVPDESEQVIAVASIDLCEVVRKTADGMARFAGRQYAGNDYAAGLWRDTRLHTDRDYSYNTITPIIQSMTNHGKIEPVEGIQEIGEMMRSWRQLGVVCVANTSTLPGCEVKTVEFLQTELPNCFDGIVFPRNFDGNGAITKAHALSQTVEVLRSAGHSPGYAVHIDDAPHHVRAMLANPPQGLKYPEVFCVVPAYEGNVALAGLADVIRVHSPLEAFEVADAGIRELAA